MDALTGVAERLAAVVGANLVVEEGPFKGYHHDAYAVRVDAGSPIAQRFPPLQVPRFKLSERRPGVFWYDLRCCGSDEKLITLLRDYIPRVPQVLSGNSDNPEISVRPFIEGRTLRAISGAGKPIDKPYCDQIEKLFRSLARFDVGILESQGICDHGGIDDRQDSSGFLRRLVKHTTDDVYAHHRAEYGLLFDRLGVPADALILFEKEMKALTRRPYQLLHGDLHRENFIVDAVHRLWTIDWDLAQVGDPVYDLATHLYLMQYPANQEKEMLQRWCRAVEAARPGASRDVEADLPTYLAYKRIQSAYTDTIRGAASLGSAATEAQRHHVAVAVERVLTVAQQPLRMGRVPTVAEIDATVADWHRSHSRWASMQ